MRKLLSVAVLAASLGTAATTFTKDVAPILYARCVQCHRPNDIAPMSLLDYKSARPWAKSIREAVLTGKMPPWFADPHYGNFANDARLPAREIETIEAWVDGGAPEGNPRDLPYLHGFQEGALASFLPGRPPDVFPDGSAKWIPPGAKLEFVIHYARTPDRGQTDRTSVGLYLAPGPPAKILRRMDLRNFF